jgi:hypothetical protein
MGIYDEDEGNFPVKFVDFLLLFGKSEMAQIEDIVI